ncbi:hypothetical protein EBQ34_12800 [Vandammella animalimorsus]|uniref:C-type lysozyme inhibitor domain-containing protein n=1 Tax=Vandammella animalimorsus TaxID=2029117 RepID=A0A3M6R4N6_9BURK|nr:MliC family protein [Vandammella animalimorsus]RMX10080.1 hypothetical protein EBQ34_12800 [Vandammella animalimorsus]
MNIKTLSMLVGCAVALAACSGTKPKQPQNPVAQAATAAAPAAQQAMASQFSCENGMTVWVQPRGTEQVEIKLDGKSAVLDIAVSGSGERYVGKTGLFGRGGEWHQKGNQAFFSFYDPYNNLVETNCTGAN